MEIRKTDLRLGNIFKEGVVCKINGRAGSKVHVCGRLEYRDGKLKNRTEVPAESLTPIKLTSEILVNWCGFRDVGDKIYVCDDYSLLDVGEGNMMHDYVILAGLHELQNLHKVLTKEELEIKE